MTDLSVRLYALAFSLKDADPELAAHLLVLDKLWRDGKKRRAKVRKVRLSGKGKAGQFYVPDELVKESER